MTAQATGRIIPFPGLPTPALQLRVELLLQPHTVWRRLVLGANATFWDLHVAIQDAFGWDDRHLHRFTVDAPEGGAALHFGIPDDSDMPAPPAILACWEHRLARYLKRDAAAALYVYDFAVEWQHAVELETILSGVAASTLPRCDDGDGWPPLPAEGGTLTRAAAGFDPDRIRFANPQQQWARKFGHE